MIRPLLSVARGALSDDTAIVAALGRVWMIAASVITLPLLAIYLTNAERGYYISFQNLGAATVFIELGLQQVLMQYLSRNAAELRSDRNGWSGPVEARHKVGGLFRFACRWYLLGAVLFLLAGEIGGLVFFSASEDPGISWRGAWVTYVACVSCNLVLLPFFVLLESLNKVRMVARFRLLTGLIATLVSWISLAAEARLWTLVASYAAVLAANLWLAFRWRRLFGGALKDGRGDTTHWLKTMWAFQWRVALSWISGYFCWQMVGPLTFQTIGAVAAGRVGLTMQASSAVFVIAMAWLQTKTPSLAALLGLQKVADARRLFRTSTLQALLIAVTASAAGWTAIWFLKHWTGIGETFTTLTATALLLLATIANCAINAMAVYLRARLQEPFYALSVFLAVCIPTTVWIFGRQWEEIGVAGAYSGTTILLGLPVAFWLFTTSLKPGR